MCTHTHYLGWRVLDVVLYSLCLSSFLLLSFYPPSPPPPPPPPPPPTHTDSYTHNYFINVGKRALLTYSGGAFKACWCLNNAGYREVHTHFMELISIHYVSVPLLNVFLISRLLITEKAGLICRDDTVEGLRFYPNLFLHPDPDA